MRKCGAENRSRGIAFQQYELAAVIARQFVGDGEPKAGPADQTGKCFKQMLVRLRR